MYHNIYSLHTVTNSETFDRVPLNTCDLAILVFATVFSAPTSSTYIVSITIYS